MAKCCANICGAFPRILHIVAMLQFGYALYYDFVYVKFPKNVQAPHGFGRYAYLTFYGLVSTTNSFNLPRKDCSCRKDATQMLVKHAMKAAKRLPKLAGC